MGRPSCAITVKGSWWRPTISIPNTRSDGARRTCRPIARVMIVATTATATTSAVRPGNVHHRREDQHRARNRPPAHVAHVRPEAGVHGEDVQHEQTRLLREAQHHETAAEALPADGDEGCDPQREIEADLERREKGD